MLGGIPVFRRIYVSYVIFSAPVSGDLLKSVRQCTGILSSSYLAVASPGHKMFRISFSYIHLIRARIR